ncbi:MAG: lipid II flippase MurJ [Bacteroidota bacterium]|nr:lipid II flippase MurJ [Bacteroidota bacterium]
MKISFLQTESYRKGLFYSSGFNVLAKILAFSQSLVIAYYFGTKSETDVFFYCLSSVGLISIYFGSLNHTVLIPEAMRIRVQESNEQAIIFLNFFLYLYSFISMVLTLILLANPIKIFSILSNFNENTLNISKELVFYSIPLLMLMNLTSYLTDILTSYKYFTIPMIAAMVNSLFVLLFIFLFHNSLSILSILWGLIFGYMLNIVLLTILLKRMGWAFKFKFIKINLRIKKNIFYAQLGNITTTVGSFLPLFLISGFNSGIIAALNYGQKISTIPDQFFTTQMSQVIAIKFNELSAKKDYSTLNKTFFESLSTLVFILIPISLVLFFFPAIIVKVLYQRGQFDQNSVKITSEFLKYFGLLLPFLAINTIISRLFTASQKVRINFFSQIVMIIIFIPTLYFLLKIMGPIGYPVAVLCYLCISILLISIFLIKKNFPFINLMAISHLFVKILFINIFIIAPFFVLAKYFEINSMVFVLFIVYYISILFFLNYKYAFCLQINELQKKYFFNTNR